VQDVNLYFSTPNTIEFVNKNGLFGRCIITSRVFKPCILSRCYTTTSSCGLV